MWRDRGQGIVRLSSVTNVFFPFVSPRQAQHHTNRLHSLRGEVWRGGDDHGHGPHADLWTTAVHGRSHKILTLPVTRCLSPPPSLGELKTVMSEKPPLAMPPRSQGGGHRSCPATSCLVRPESVAGHSPTGYIQPAQTPLPCELRSLRELNDPYDPYDPYEPHGPYEPYERPAVPPTTNYELRTTNRELRTAPSL